MALSSVTHLAPAGVPQPGPLTHLATSRHSLHGNLGARDHQCWLPDVTQVGGRWLTGVLGPSGGQGKVGGREVISGDERKRESGRADIGSLRRFSECKSEVLGGLRKLNSHQQRLLSELFQYPIRKSL